MGGGRPVCVLWWPVVAFILQVSGLRMAQATFIFTAYINVSFVDPGSNETMWRQEESGLYGQDSPKDSVLGRVYIAEPIYGCDTDTEYNVPEDSEGWIALIQRGNGCTFSDKIKAAASKGAIAVVIFNEPSMDNRVIQMSHPGTGDTVAIMIGYIRGMEIVSLISRNIEVNMSIRLANQHGSWLSQSSVFFVSISFFVVTAATVSYFIFYSARRLNNVRLQNRKEKLLKAEAKKAIGQLEVRTLKQGDQELGPDADSCAVCIDAYKPGDVVSILTCNHFFHKQCIEPWLLEHRTCPMCKCDILKALGVEPEEMEVSHQIPMPPDFRAFPSSQEDSRSETASSGYASVQGTEEHNSPIEENTYEAPLELNPVQGETSPEDQSVRVDIQPHYDNMAFEGDVQSQQDPDI